MKQLRELSTTNLRAGAPRKPRLNPCQVMITVPHCVIFENKLARQRRIPVKRNRRGTIKLRIRQRPYLSGRRSAVVREQFQRFLFGSRVVILRVAGVHLINVRHGNTRGRSRSNTVRELDLDWINRGHVIHDDSDFPALGQT